MGESSFVFKLLHGLEIFMTLIRINLTFLLANFFLLVYLYLLSVQKVEMYLFLMVILLFPLGPSIFAVYSCVDDMVTQKEKFSVKKFFLTMKKIVTKELIPILGLIYSTVGILMLYSLESVNFNIAILLPVYIFIICLNILSLPILCIEIKTFSNSNLGHLKNTLIILLSQWKLIVFQLVYLILFYLILKEIPALLFFVGTSLFAYLFLIIYKPSIIERVEKLKAGQE